MSDFKDFVLTGNTTEYDYYIREIQKTPAMQGRNAKREFPLLFQQEQLQGHTPSQVWVWGTWETNEDSKRLSETAENYGWTVVDAPAIWRLDTLK